MRQLRMSDLCIDINADLGESEESLANGTDFELMRYITSANVACLFAGAQAPAAHLEDADGVDQHIVFANQILDLVLRVAAAVIAAIGDNQQRFSILLRLLHLVHG